VRMPKGFFPQQDTGFITARIEAAPDISFGAMRERMEQVNAIIMADPAVAAFPSFVGGGRGGGSLNTGRAFINLKARGERDHDTVVMARLRQKISAIPGITFFPQSRQDLRIGGLSSKTQYQYTLRAVDSTVLNDWAPRLVAKLQQLPELRDVTSDQETGAPALSIEIDRQAASRFGIEAAAINRALYNAFGQRQITQFYTEVSQYKVIIEVPRSTNCSSPRRSPVDKSRSRPSSRSTPAPSDRSRSTTSANTRRSRSPSTSRPTSPSARPSPPSSVPANPSDNPPR
jgi:multidrug efflux pump subunit AcrB